MKENASRSKLNATGVVGVLVVGTLAAGAFAAGSYLGPARPAGHNLYHPAPAPAPHSPLVLASAGRPVTVAANGGGDPGSESDSPDEFVGAGPGVTFDKVYRLLKAHYVDTLPDDAKFGHGAAAAMVASLQDPDSRFMEASEVAELGSEAKGIYHGIGAALAVKRVLHVKTVDLPAYTEYRLVVIAPVPGSPAEKAGIQPGDVIASVNGVWVYNDKFVYDQARALKALQDDAPAYNKTVTALQKKIDNSVSLNDAQTKLDDPAAKTITLSVMRAGALHPTTLTLDTSTPTTISPIVSRSLPGGIGYIKIVQFTPDADKDFAAALASFGTDPKGLILDLRNTLGGLRAQTDAETAIAARLTAAPVLGYIETKGKKVQPITLTAGASVTYPIAVLVNAGTDNTAELLAAALQSKGAKLVGSKTFGDAGDVKLITLRDGSGFTMTIGKLTTATRGQFGGGVGLKPDVLVPDTAGDEPLNRAVGVLSGRVARLPSTRS